MIEHKHATEIKAWAEGYEIEFRYGNDDWRTATQPTWIEQYEYRVRPNKNQEIIDAYKAGAAIQFRSRSSGINDLLHLSNDWLLVSVPSWLDEYEYRVKPHKHQACMDRFKKGHAIQSRCSEEFDWSDITNPSWIEDFEYRVKPEKLIIRYAPVGHTIIGDDCFAVGACTTHKSLYGTFISQGRNMKQIGQLKLTIDKETMKIDSVEVYTP